MKKYTLLLVTFIFTTLSYAQEYDVTGIVVDKQAGGALEYATVSLHQQEGNTLVTGQVTNAKGKFHLKVPQGNYKLSIRFISYKSLEQNIQVTGNMNVGTLSLSPDSEMLDDVVVAGEKSSMSIQLDKRVFNVGSDLRNAGGNAADILDNVPSVAVDVEGNVSLRGNENVQVLIDGKPSGLIGMGGTDALRQLQGSLIERIEVVTNPSARYSAQGMTGIINIVLKKENREGFNGAFSVNAGHPLNYGGSFDINYRKKWFNFFSSFGINYRESPGGGYTNQEFNKEDTTYYTNLIQDRNRSGLSENVKIGMDFFLNDYNTLTVSALYKISDQENESLITYKDLDINRMLISQTQRIDDEMEDDENMEYSLNYTRTFEREGQKLTADFQYRNNAETEDSDIVEKSRLASDQNYTPSLFQRSLNTESEKGWLIQTDYEHPFRENGKLQVGYKANIRLMDNGYEVEEEEDDIWENLEEFTNHLDYNEAIHAGYFTIGNKVNQISWQGGLRMEYSDIEILQKESSEQSHKKYTDFFPSLHLSYELNKDDALQISYSRRINRPRFRELNPFSSFSDARNIRAGNPDLNPEYTDAYEIGFLQNGETSSFLHSIYYRHTTGVINRVTVERDAVLFTMPVNLGSSDAYGVELTGSKDLTDWWKIDGSANFYHERTRGSANGEDLSSNPYTMSARLNSKMTITKRYDFQISTNYRAPTKTAQGKRKAMYHIDLGASTDVLNNNGTLTLSVKDLLNSRKWRSETFGNDFHTEGEFQWRSRQISLSFTYRLNRKKKKEKPGGGYNDEGDMDF